MIKNVINQLNNHFYLVKKIGNQALFAPAFICLEIKCIKDNSLIFQINFENDFVDKQNQADEVPKRKKSRMKLWQKREAALNDSTAVTY
jgi:hypothetical protein